MSAIVLPESDLTVEQSFFLWWKFSRPEILFSEQGIDGTGVYTCQEHASCIHPLTFDSWRAYTDEYRPRRAKRYQLMRVHRKIVWRQWACVFNEIAGKPMVF